MAKDKLFEEGETQYKQTFAAPFHVFDDDGKTILLTVHGGQKVRYRWCAKFTVDRGGPFREVGKPDDIGFDMSTKRETDYGLRRAR